MSTTSTPPLAGDASRTATILLVVATLLFGAGAVTLWSAFSAQADTRIRELVRAQRSDEALAATLLAGVVERLVDDAALEIEAASRDALKIRPGLYLSTGGGPQLPAPTPLAATPAPARSPTHTRRRSLARAVHDAEPQARGDAYAAFRAHRRTVALDAYTEVQTLLDVAEALAEPVASPSVIADLFAALLAGRSGLSADDAKALTVQACALAAKHNVTCTHMSMLMNLEPIHFLGRIPRNGPSIALVDEDVWLLRPQGEGHIGVRVSQLSISDVLTSALQRPHEDGGAPHRPHVAFAPAPSMQARPVGNATLRVDAARYRDATHAALYDVRLAHSVVALCFVLALIALGFAYLLWARRRRYHAMKQRFYAAVSHELKTPLASMRVMAETLQRKLDGDPRAKDYPARLVGDVDHMSTLVDNILSYTRLERGTVELRRDDVMAAELVAEVAGELRHGPPRSLAVDIDIDAHAIWHVDPTWMRVLFSNLLRNARAYNVNALAQVSVCARTDAGGLTVTVSDNGVGVAPEEHRRVFSAFVRGHTPGGPQVRGSGLGLALCRDIVALHGGRIEIDRSGPSGTTFRMTFPHSMTSQTNPEEARVGTAQPARR